MPSKLIICASDISEFIKTQKNMSLITILKSKDDFEILLKDMAVKNLAKWLKNKKMMDLTLENLFLLHAV
jgi:hypothetical protein